MHGQSITTSCPICGKSFSLNLSAYKSGIRCCSRACSLVRRRLRKRSVEERFWDLVAKAGPDECWLWIGGKAGPGYGIFCHVRGQSIGAHRFAWQLVHGPIPEGIYVCHNCPSGDNPSCVNVAHLFLGTAADNNRDTIRKGRAGTFVPPPMLGEAHHQAKLNEQQVLEIISRRHESRVALAAEYKVCVGTIKAIWGRRSWRHLHTT